MNIWLKNERVFTGKFICFTNGSNNSLSEEKNA